MNKNRRFRVLALVTFLLAPLPDGNPTEMPVPAKRKSAASQIAKDLERLTVHRIYVSDFADASGRRVASGCFFAAYFSKLVAEHSKRVTTVNRVEVHRYLEERGWTERDLSKPDVMSKLVSEFGLDGILFGVISNDRRTFTIDFTMRNTAGGELFRTQYREAVEASVIANLPIGDEPSEGNLYFAGLDGVTMPQCRRCPIPRYPEGKRNSRVQGSIVLSVVITPDGHADQIYLVTKLDPDLDQDAIRAVKSWTFSPSKNSDGTNVPIRVPIEVTYRVY